MRLPIQMLCLSAKNKRKGISNNQLYKSTTETNSNKSDTRAPHQQILTFFKYSVT